MAVKASLELMFFSWAAYQASVLTTINMNINDALSITDSLVSKLPESKTMIDSMNMIVNRNMVRVTRVRDMLSYVCFSDLRLSFAIVPYSTTNCTYGE